MAGGYFPSGLTFLCRRWRSHLRTKKYQPLQCSKNSHLSLISVFSWNTIFLKVWPNSLCYSCWLKPCDVEALRDLICLFSLKRWRFWRTVGCSLPIHPFSAIQTAILSLILPSLPPSLPPTPSFLKKLFIFMYTVVLHAMFVYDVCAVPTETRGGRHILRYWSYRWLLAAMWGRESNLGPLEEQPVSSVNCWVISPTPQLALLYWPDPFV